MPRYTDNYNLILPEQSENYNVEIANINNRIIDNQLGNKVEKIPGKGLSSNDFTDGYKKKIDSLQRLYKFKGNAETLAEIRSKTNNNLGDVWKCLEDGNNYCWNDEEWVNIGKDIDMEDFVSKEDWEETEEEITKIKNDLQEKSSLPKRWNKASDIK